MSPEFMNSILMALLQLVGVFATGAVGFAAQQLRRRWGIDIEARHREAFASAIENAARVAILKGPDEAKDVLVDHAIAYVRESVPDALKVLAPAETLLRDRALSALAKEGQR